ncbi:MAG: CRTAC1 family protein [Phycisphaera sp.]|nr:CRTAC1 family protein [Phycisphaera sp.]
MSTRSWTSALAIVVSSTTILVACDRAPDTASPSPTNSTAIDSARDGTKAVDSRAMDEPWFVEVAADRGIDFQHDSGARGRFRLPESLGAGCALFDADGDGDLDAYLVRGHDLDEGPDPETSSNRFFRNDGTGRFTDDTRASGLGDPGYGTGVAVGDVDGDGDLDLYLANLGVDRLFMNDGSGGFAPTGDLPGSPDHSVAPCFIDFDRDGDLDLFIARYMDWSPEMEVECTNLLGERDYCNPALYGDGIADRLLQNDGDGLFTDVSETSGISAVAGTGLAAASTDLDGDGWPDIFVANDKTPDRLWINQRDGSFREEAGIRGCAMGLDGSPRAGMSVAFADLDHDGDFEIHVSNIDGEADGLFQNNDGHFFDRATGWGIAATSRNRTRWAGHFRDFDLDGRPELLVACGRVLRKVEEVRPGHPYAEEDLLFSFDEKGRFRKVEGAWPAELPAEATHGVAIGDVDGDGHDDLLTVSRDGPARLLLRNVTNALPDPVRFDLRTSSGAPAIGAILEVTRNDSTTPHPIDTAGGYASASSHVISVAGPVESVSIRWADGTTETRNGPFAAGEPVRIEAGGR